MNSSPETGTWWPGRCERPMARACSVTVATASTGPRERRPICRSATCLASCCTPTRNQHPDRCNEGRSRCRVPAMHTRRARPHGTAVVTIYLTAVIAIHAAAARSASAETDLSGEWTPRYHEDLPERIPGPALGEYHGIPLNDAARRRAESWSASILSVLEHQCVPHPADYATRGPSHMRIWKEVDRNTQQQVAMRMRISAWGTGR